MAVNAPSLSLRCRKTRKELEFSAGTFQVYTQGAV